jgi:NitT/TauT family transport system ATP-binding protein
MTVSEPLISLTNVCFGYPSRPQFFRDLSLRVFPGEILCLVGVSGIGKTSVLRLMQGLEAPHEGRVCASAAVKDRGIASVSQHYGLLPHLTAEGNVRLVLRKNESWWRRLLPNAEAQEKALGLLGRVGLGASATAYPHQLSGGQRQRVRLAQALGQDAPLLLLDEPFAALDASIREQLQMLVLSLSRREQLGVVLVTHDLEEALFLADRLFILRPDGDHVCLVQIPVDPSPLRSPVIKAGEWFFKQLQALRAEVGSVLPLEADGTDRHVESAAFVNEQALASIERLASEVWVISNQLQQDLENPLIHDAVLSNLAAGKRYCYYVPAGALRPSMIVDGLRSQSGAKPDQIVLWELPSDTAMFLFGEIVIFDPGTGSSKGYTYLGGENRGLLMRLTQRFVEHITGWLQVHRSTQSR